MPLPSRAQGLPTSLLDRTAEVYLETDDFVAPVKTGLRCRLGNIDANGAVTGNERAQLLALRRLFWTPDYFMPEGAQVAIDGQRWNTMRGSFAAVDGAVTGPLYRSCDVQRA